jgi:hypothetical protein
MRKLFFGALVLPFAIAALPAAADTDAELLYSRYHEAIEVAKLCRDITFDQGDIDRMAAVIHDRIGHDIGAKRLKLLTAGQRAGDELVKSKGCESDEAKSLLALYDADLAPVVD